VGEIGRSKPVEAYIGLGSNLGDRASFVASALKQLTLTKGIRVEAVSSVVDTEPVGPVSQPNFLNAVARIQTTLAPLELLERLLAIERELGRTRRERWGPRTIDLDILFYGDETFVHPQLAIPHPEIGNRPFIQSALRELGKPL
jgi:2-amino-4-hydroxy-6-hydroxymethyldihydropteridine diphosphokinase